MANMFEFLGAPVLLKIIDFLKFDKEKPIILCEKTP